MHILIIPSWFPSSVDGVAGIFFLEQAVALAEYEKKVGILAVNLYSLKKSKFEMPRPDFPKSINVVNFEGKCFPRQIPYVSWLQYKIKGKELYEKYVFENGKPDIIIAQACLWGGVLACYLNNKHEIPYIIIEHHSHYLEGKTLFWQKKLLKKAFTRSSRNLAVSKCLAESVSKQMHTEVEVLPNMVNDCFLEQPFYSGDKKTVLAVCGLSKLKNVQSLIVAYNKYLKGSGYKLKIGGDGEERQNLEELVEALDLSEEVIFTGWLTREQVINEIAQCNVLVLASTFETFGMVLIESMALGIPVIATKCGGPQDIVDESNGMLVEINNIDSMGKALIECVSKNYDKEYLRKLCRSKYSSKVIITRLLDLLKECLCVE